MNNNPLSSTSRLQITIGILKMKPDRVSVELELISVHHADEWRLLAKNMPQNRRPRPELTELSTAVPNLGTVMLPPTAARRPCSRSSIHPPLTTHRSPLSSTRPAVHVSINHSLARAPPFARSFLHVHCCGRYDRSCCPRSCCPTSEVALRNKTSVWRSSLKRWNDNRRPST